MTEAEEHEIDRQEYNCAVANGLIIRARQIDRRMKARERNWERAARREHPDALADKWENLL